MNRFEKAIGSRTSDVSKARTINGVAWSVPPDAARHTRPVQLIEQLSRIGLVSDEATFIHAGRAPTVDAKRARVRAPWYPTVPRAIDDWAVLSPVFRGVRQIVWSDFYDDWSIAPDINPLHRAIAAGTYRRIRRGLQEPSTTVTVNTRYMARKLGLEDRQVVPNGVDPRLAEIPITGDSRDRLVVLGTFMDGRTDWEMLRGLVLSGRWQEVVIGAPGTAAAMQDVLDKAEQRSDVNLKVVDWLPIRDLGTLAGSKTVCLIPHVVNDYTLSQDLMKAYQFAVLGIPTLIPAELIPPGLETSAMVPVSAGASVDGLRIPALLPFASRIALCAKHSWEVRAQQVADLVTEGQGR